MGSTYKINGGEAFGKTGILPAGLPRAPAHSVRTNSNGAGIALGGLILLDVRTGGYVCRPLQTEFQKDEGPPAPQG